MICEVAPAKINLTLEILGKREDGYHDINSVMQTIDLCDILTFWKNEWLHVVPEYGSLPGNDTLSTLDGCNYLGENLVYRAAKILKDETGYSGGALIQLRKSIPSAAGLGGGSSDAAAALKGLNRLWKLGLSTDELIEIGAKIGSDIAFFIHGGTCLIEGRGEIVRPVKPLPAKWFLILLIPMILRDKTKRLYSYIDSSNYSEGKKTADLLEKIKDHYGNKDNPGHGIKSSLFNVFERVYDNGCEEFRQWKEYTDRLDLEPLHLAGSGPAVYYISDDEKELLDLANHRLSGQKEIKKYIARAVP
ncbi:MAG: 4-(cytidine 5'-diphospho)-2-C-methyl-D-erythritol kinase [Actinomycetia bacterium]|nr:4-(cytidine 5'-diphospho)-2-C-methyl-D-erythritol kinase [Actinomycetes bacterium]